MKTNIPIDKIKDYLKKHRKILTYIAFFALLIFVTISAYSALNPHVDEGAMTAGEQKLDELDVTFDKKTLEELQQEQAPTDVTGQGGRNPFMPY